MPSDPSKHAPKTPTPEADLFAAISAGDMPGVEMALEHGAGMDCVNEQGATPVCWAAMCENEEAFLRLAPLVDDRALFGKPGDGMMGVVDMAFASKSTRCALALIGLGRSRFDDEQGRRSFARAVVMEKADIVSALAKLYDMSERAFMKRPDGGGSTALELAASLGRPDSVRALLAGCEGERPPGHFESALRMCEDGRAPGRKLGEVIHLLREAMAAEARKRLAEDVPDPAGAPRAGPRV